MSCSTLSDILGAYETHLKTALRTKGAIVSDRAAPLTDGSARQTHRGVALFPVSTEVQESTNEGDHLVEGLLVEVSWRLSKRQRASLGDALAFEERVRELMLEDFLNRGCELILYQGCERQRREGLLVSAMAFDLYRFSAAA